jgi:hypothetical protein
MLIKRLKSGCAILFLSGIRTICELSPCAFSPSRTHEVSVSAAAAEFHASAVLLLLLLLVVENYKVRGCGAYRYKFPLKLVNWFRIFEVETHTVRYSHKPTF